MSDALGLLILLGSGVGLGYFLTRRPLARKPASIAGAAVLAAPVLLFIFAVAVGSDTLAAIAGFSMMMLLPLALIVGVGALAGRWFGRRSPIDALPPDRTPAPPQAPPTAAPSTTAPPTAAPSASLHTLWAQQRGVLLITTNVASLFWFVFAIGYYINEPFVPPVLRMGFVPAAIVLIATTAISVRHLWINRSTSVGSFSFAALLRERRERANAMAERIAWLTAIAKDPKRQRYLAMIQSGDLFWTPDRVEYDLNPQATACCVHLAPIESALRAAGVRVTFSGYKYVTADCRIDESKLAQRFPLPEHAKYQELQIYDRSLEDPPQARIHCVACSSGISVHHPRVAPENARVFPE